MTFDREMEIKLRSKDNREFGGYYDVEDMSYDGRRFSFRLKYHGGGKSKRLRKAFVTLSPTVVEKMMGALVKHVNYAAKAKRAEYEEIAKRGLEKIGRDVARNM